MKNLCKWGVIAVGYRTASGYDELIAAFQTKDEARAWLMMRVPTAKHRHPWKVERLVFDEPTQDPHGCVLPEMHDGPCQYEKEVPE